MDVDIVAPAGSVWSGEAEQVRVPATDGEMGILAGHTPLVALLNDGNVTVTHDGVDEVFSVVGGFVTVDHNHVYILVEDADKVTD